MQFTQIVMAIALAAGASAVAVEKRGDSGSVPTCSSIAICSTGGKSYCESPEPCEAAGGSPYCCTTTGLVNVLNCVNLLDGNTVTLDLPVSVSIPISL